MSGTWLNTLHQLANKILQELCEWLATSIVTIYRKGIEVTEKVGCPGYNGGSWTSGPQSLYCLFAWGDSLWSFRI